MRRPLLALSALTSLVVLAAACGGKSHGSATALWSADASAIENPWPSDRLLVGGHAGTPVGYFTRALPALPELQTARDFLDAATLAVASNGGYSVYAPVIVPLSSRVDPATVTGVHLYPAAGGADVAVDLSWSDSLGSLLVSPHAPLTAGAQWVLAVADGHIAPSTEFTAALDTDATLGALADAAVAHGAAASRRELDVLLSFTTAPIADGLVAVQARIDGVLGDALVADTTSDPGIANYPLGTFAAGSAPFAQIMSQAGAATAGIASITQGSWQAFDFRTGPNELFDPLLLATSGGTPATTTVDFRLCIPSGTPPPNGWPIVITSHGLTSDSDEAVARCSSFAKAGIALVGQTATDHGFRGSVLHFFDFRRLLAVRDEFRQSDAEILQMQRLLLNSKNNGVAPFNTLDAANPHYWGNSLGALFGGAVIATSSHLHASGLSVPGARLTTLFDGKAGGVLLAVFAGDVGLDTNADYFPGFMDAFRAVAQDAIDAADPGALAPHTPASRPVLLQESLGDGTILNSSTENLRAAFGFQVYTAPSDPFSGAGAMWVWDKDQFSNLPADEDPHNLYWDCKQMRHQMEDWINSDGTRLTDPQS